MRVMVLILAVYLRLPRRTTHSITPLRASAR